MVTLEAVQRADHARRVIMDRMNAARLDDANTPQDIHVFRLEYREATQAYQKLRRAYRHAQKQRPQTLRLTVHAPPPGEENTADDTQGKPREMRGPARKVPGAKK